MTLFGHNVGQAITYIQIRGAVLEGIRVKLIHIWLLQVLRERGEVKSIHVWSLEALLGHNADRVIIYLVAKDMDGM